MVMLAGEPGIGKTRLAQELARDAQNRGAQVRCASTVGLVPRTGRRSSITTFLKKVNRSQQLLLVLDDLHWADESSLLLLEFLAREISSSLTMVVGTYRDREVTGSPDRA